MASTIAVLWVGGNREKNTFCTKLTDTNYVKMYSQLSQNPQNVVNAWAKYTALNLAPIASKGTIEFRHLCGSINKDYIIGWINLISCLKGMAKKNTAQALSNEICMLNTDSAYDDFAFRVFGKYTVSLLTEGYIESMEHACSYIKLATIYLDAPVEHPKVRIHGDVDNRNAFATFGAALRAEYPTTLGREAVHGITQLGMDEADQAIMAA